MLHLLIRCCFHCCLRHRDLGLRRPLQLDHSPYVSIYGKTVRIQTFSLSQTAPYQLRILDGTDVTYPVILVAPGLSVPLPEGIVFVHKAWLNQILCFIWRHAGLKTLAPPAGFAPVISSPKQIDIAAGSTSKMVVATGAQQYHTFYYVELDTSRGSDGGCYIRGSYLSEIVSCYNTIKSKSAGSLCDRTPLIAKPPQATQPMAMSQPVAIPQPLAASQPVTFSQPETDSDARRLYHGRVLY